MRSPARLTWKEMEPSPALAARIADEVDTLDTLYGNITSCRVVVEQAGRRHRKGRHYAVKIELSVPGRQLAATADPPEHKNNEDAWAAVNEAFGAMRRQLEDYARVRRGQVKRHIDRVGVRGRRKVAT